MPRAYSNRSSSAATFVEFRFNVASSRRLSFVRLVEWVLVEWVFEGEIIEWRGPAPYFFVAMSESDSAELKEAARSLIYWGQVPVHVVIGDTTFRTALFPKDGRYLVPLKDAVRTAEGMNEGDVVAVTLRPARRNDVH